MAKLQAGATDGGSAFRPAAVAAQEAARGSSSLVTCGRW